MHPILFQIGSITIYTYGFFVFIGTVSGYLLGLSQAKKENISQETFSDIFFWSILTGFISARLTYILVEFPNFLAHPWQILLSRSGFVFLGGMLGGLLTFWLLSIKYKINFKKLTDTMAASLALGHAFGRIGCFFYGCCWGKPTNSIIGVLFPHDSPAGQCGLKVIPTQLIEASFLFILAGTLWIKSKKKDFDGQIFILYLFSYGCFRFIIEFFRDDPRGSILGLSTSQIISILIVIIAVFMKINWSKKPVKG